MKKLLILVLLFPVIVNAFANLQVSDEEVNEQLLGTIAFNTQEEAEAAGWSINRHNTFNEPNELVIVKKFINGGYKWVYGTSAGEILQQEHLIDMWGIYIPGDYYGFYWPGDIGKR